VHDVAAVDRAGAPIVVVYGEMMSTIMHGDGYPSASRWPMGTGEDAPFVRYHTGHGTVARRRPRQRFSGGMRRRLEIARALQHRPRILFLDEPTSGLDPQTRNQIWEFIRALSRDEGVTVFFTTHYMEEAARVADRIAVIDHGRIVAEGTAAALRQETGGRTLEDAFIALTGHGIREAEAAPIDRMRMMRRVWLGRR
jgi:ABC-type proline/glycine betaine transport system ATPase subunit